MSSMKYQKKCPNKACGLYSEEILTRNGVTEYYCQYCGETSYSNGSELMTKEGIEHENDMF